MPVYKAPIRDFQFVLHEYLNVEQYKDVPGFAGYRFGLADEQVSPVRKPLEGLPATNAQGNADILVQLPALPKTNRQLEADVILKLRESGGRTIERT